MGSWQQSMQRFGRTRAFAAVHKRIAPFDGWLFRVSRGRLSTARLVGVEQVLLTTTGRKSGLPRTVPLVCIRDDDGHGIVVGSNYGQERDPAWALNLLANPDAALQPAGGGAEVPVRARVAEGDERARLWERIVRTWPAYDTYAERTSRDIRVFVLEPR
jgi:deazaflavin-dependent oxidoreductase (nitroreductase family)